MGNMMVMVYMVVDDEIFKNMFVNNVFENFEIVVYKLLLVFCGVVGVVDVKFLLEVLLKEE